MPVRSIGSTARYAIPSLRSFVVARPRLLDRLHAAVGNGVTELQAPGGYGKTTLAAQFARDVDFEARWLLLDPSCRAPETFAEQLVRAILGSEAWQPATAEGDGALAAYVGAALREFDRDTPRPLLLVIDNAHELNHAEASSDLLVWLLQSLPMGSEVLLLTREPLPLPDLDRQVAGGDALLLTTADLAFTLEEVEAVLSHEAPARLPPAELVHSETGGWPVAVRGIASGTLRIEDAGRAVASGVWDRYLASEVWAVVPAELQHSLMLSAVPPSMEPALVAALMPGHEWQAIETWLDEQDFFVEHYPGNGRRLNLVIQRFLRDRLQQFDAAAYQQSATAVVRELEKQRRITEALEVAATLQTREELGALLRSHAHMLLQRGSFATLKRAFVALGDACAEDSLLTAIHARVLAQVDQPDEALELGGQVLDRPGSSIEARHHARLARARALRLLGRMREVPAALDAPLDDVPGDRILQAEFAWHRAHASLALDSNLDNALNLLNESLQAARDAGAPTLELLCRSTIGQVLGMKGDGPASVRELAEAASGWRQDQGTAHLPWVLNNLGMAHITVGDMANAISALTEARQESIKAGNLRAEAFAIASLGDAHLAYGHAEDACNYYEEAIRICADHPLDQSLAVLATVGLSAALLDLGDLGRADFVVRGAKELLEGMDTPFEIGSCMLQQAAVASACEQHTEAIDLATKAVELLQATGAEANVRTALYRLALIYFRDGNREAAEEVVERLSASLTEAWMARGLAPLLREHPLFAQWVGQRPGTSPILRHAIREVEFVPPAKPSEEPQRRYPRIIAQSLGALRILRDGEEVADEAWESIRAKELFYLFLARPDGIRKEQAFEQLYPGLPASRCNSQFHSNLYRVRKALYKESVIKRDGAYILNPEGEFTWDVREFEALLDGAAELEPGSAERAAAYEQALQTYRGPFAEAFYSEWATTLRESLERKNIEVLAGLAGFYATRGEFEAAAACMEQILNASRFNDEAAAMLATYRARAGQPTSALAFLDDYRQELRREIREDLPPRLQRLRHAIASGSSV
jgi:LuxR family transcriptional regulator, maltose regulon positive regulatory protein